MLRQYAVQDSLQIWTAFSTHSSAATAAGRLQTIHVMCFLPEPLHQHGNLRTVLNEPKSFFPTTNFVCFSRYLWTLEVQKLTFGRNFTQWQSEPCVNETTRQTPTSCLSLWASPDGTNWYITKGKVITAHSAIELSSALWECKINTFVTKCWLYTMFCWAVFMAYKWSGWVPRTGNSLPSIHLQGEISRGERSLVRSCQPNWLDSEI
jgi:hypothetical protein